nr:hypothetical protein [Paraburkholderia sp. BL23I1N1]
MQIVGAEFAAARKTVAVATEAARAATAEAPATATAAMVIMAADGVPQCVKREAVVAVMAEEVAVTEAVAVVATAMPAFVVLEFVPAAIVAALVASELVSPVTATLVVMKLVPIAASTMTAFKTFTAALAAELVMTGEHMPKRMQRRAILPCEKTFVRATRTGKTMVMTHLGYSHLYLKMCCKIYI